MVKHLKLQFFFVSLTAFSLKPMVDKKYNFKPPKPLEITTSNRHYDILFKNQTFPTDVMKTIRNFCVQSIYIESEEQVARYVLERKLYEELTTAENKK